MTPTDRVRVGVLASGGGTNLQALIDATADPSHPAELVVVGADRHKAHALQRARDASIGTFVVLKRDHPDRASFDRAIVEQLQAHGVQWVCCAGFMKVAGPPLLEAFPQRILNIHPTLLPAFPGLRPHEQVIEAGVRVSGCTVHICDEGTDTGPIVAQAVVPVLPDDDVQQLQARVLRMEHRLYPMVLRWAAEGRLQVRDRTATVHLRNGESTTLFGTDV
ncbi:MAG: phosphoribosylglycinamide formyltransferase [Myxococcales bacterium]|nr:phosphoribosylglycinamide formyltransferase [Myxococcales bacterium]